MNDKDKEDGREQNRKKCTNGTKSSCLPIKNPTHPLRYYEFTKDEIRALEECDKESFYQRCLPFSTLFATLTYAAVKSGYMKRNRHFGVYPKLAIAIVLGYICGRAAYIPMCEKKFRELPNNSHLGNTMRKYYLVRHPPPPQNK